MALRAEIAHTEVDSPMLETMPQNADEAKFIAGIAERMAEFAHRIALAGSLETFPLFGLGGLDEGNERIHI